MYSNSHNQLMQRLEEANRRHERELERAQRMREQAQEQAERAREAGQRMREQALEQAERAREAAQRMRERALEQAERAREAAERERELALEQAERAREAAERAREQASDSSEQPNCISISIGNFRINNTVICSNISVSSKNGLVEVTRNGVKKIYRGNLPSLINNKVIVDGQEIIENDPRLVSAADDKRDNSDGNIKLPALASVQPQNMQTDVSLLEEDKKDNKLPSTDKDEEESVLAVSLSGRRLS